MPTARTATTAPVAACAPSLRRQLPHSLRHPRCHRLPRSHHRRSLFSKSAAPAAAGCGGGLDGVFALQGFTQTGSPWYSQGMYYTALHFETVRWSGGGSRSVNDKLASHREDERDAASRSARNRTSVTASTRSSSGYIQVSHYPIFGVWSGFHAPPRTHYPTPSALRGPG
eukprot:2803947-Prymnesium_polylepis.1